MEGATSTRRAVVGEPDDFGRGGVRVLGAVGTYMGFCKVRAHIVEKYAPGEAYGLEIPVCHHQAFSGSSLAPPESASSPAG